MQYNTEVCNRMGIQNGRKTREAQSGTPGPKHKRVQCKCLAFTSEPASQTPFHVNGELHLD